LLQKALYLRQTFQDGLVPNIRVPISRRIQREHSRLKINITRIQLVVHFQERIADVAVVLVEQGPKRGIDAPVFRRDPFVPQKYSVPGGVPNGLGQP